ncbi:uncharacterized protein SRS1_12025 [Sporisorium reilianum f. sp. reilianum]|uniref:Uncharacterized protein n=1 Tax=Sporisorium reilianum f. sp. reilianum TaxID=72559 RepID=A0A2N8U7W4_9BASI|nr:uncharacterized protein SRS1_12025 [Sporisorium reilianum f. sp. reilianum]
MTPVTPTSTSSTPSTSTSSTSSTPSTPATGTTIRSDTADRRAVEHLLPACDPRTPTPATRRSQAPAPGDAASSAACSARLTGRAASVIDLTSTPATPIRTRTTGVGSGTLMDRLESTFGATGRVRASSVRPLPRPAVEATRNVTAAQSNGVRAASVAVKSEDTDAPLCLKSTVCIEIKDEDSTPAPGTPAPSTPRAAPLPTIAPASTTRSTTPSPSHQRHTTPSTRIRTTSSTAPRLPISARSPTPVTPLAAFAHRRRSGSVVPYARGGRARSVPAAVPAAVHPGWGGVDMRRQPADVVMEDAFAVPSASMTSRMRRSGAGRAPSVARSISRARSRTPGMSRSRAPTLATASTSQPVRAAPTRPTARVTTDISASSSEDSGSEDDDDVVVIGTGQASTRTQQPTGSQRRIADRNSRHVVEVAPAQGNDREPGPRRRPRTYRYVLPPPPALLPPFPPPIPPIPTEQLHGANPTLPSSPAPRAPHSTSVLIELSGAVTISDRLQIESNTLPSAKDTNGMRATLIKTIERTLGQRPIEREH